MSFVSCGGWKSKSMASGGLHSFLALSGSHGAHSWWLHSSSLWSGPCSWARLHVFPPGPRNNAQHCLSLTSSPRPFQQARSHARLLGRGLSFWGLTIHPMAVRIWPCCGPVLALSPLLSRISIPQESLVGGPRPVHLPEEQPPPRSFGCLLPEFPNVIKTRSTRDL